VLPGGEITVGDGVKIIGGRLVFWLDTWMVPVCPVEDVVSGMVWAAVEVGFHCNCRLSTPTATTLARIVTGELDDEDVGVIVIVPLYEVPAGLGAKPCKFANTVRFAGVDPLTDCEPVLLCDKLDPVLGDKLTVSQLGPIEFVVCVVTVKLIGVELLLVRPIGVGVRFTWVPIAALVLLIGVLGFTPREGGPPD
jgi:hypothetical protein